MAFKFFERPSSPTITSQSYQSTWGASGTTDGNYVRNYAIGATPALVAGLNGTLYRQDIEVSSAGWQLWDVTIPYGPLPSQDGASAAGSSLKWSFDTTGGTVRARVSKEAVASFPGGGPDFGGLIDVKDKVAQGVDVVIPSLTLNVEVDHPAGILTLAQAKALMRLTGKTNSTPFMTFSAGEVLCLGASGSDGTNVAATVSYQFACSENVTGLTIGAISSIAKKGWEVIWLLTKEEDATTHIATTPEYVYVERVYDEADFPAVLGFG